MLKRLFPRATTHNQPSATRQPRRPVLSPFHTKPRPTEIVADHLSKAGIVFNEQNSVGHRRILAATPAVPEAPAFPKLGQAVIDLAPLLGGQHFRRVAKRLGEALARRIR